MSSAARLICWMPCTWPLHGRRDLGRDLVHVDHRLAHAARALGQLVGGVRHLGRDLAHADHGPADVLAALALLAHGVRHLLRRLAHLGHRGGHHAEGRGLARGQHGRGRWTARTPAPRRRGSPSAPPPPGRPAACPPWSRPRRARPSCVAWPVFSSTWRTTSPISLVGHHGALGQLAHLVRHHREAAARLARARRLDGRVQGQQVRLVGDLLDDLQDLADVVGVAVQLRA